ncbi:diguanylate cyclase (GGDEF)-like protein [Neorhizobium alkalisoli]|uniref:diguanylate cyclase n=2 Tax=Neorhizobium alkalisoli TaxID=528178 RepID=A0A561QH29_9HYPH|nr:diguanylate cyclase (GGDEF)-like protein [Neorhizobium alkalisoli]
MYGLNSDISFLHIDGFMNGAVFFLAVNFIVAICFSAVFAVVSTRSLSRAAARWFAAGFGIASLSALCELLIAYADYQMVWAVGAFLTVLGGMLLLLVGICRLYGRPIPWLLIGGFFLASAIECILIYPLQRGTPLQAFAYQTPFALVILASSVVVLFSARRLPIDRGLFVLLLVTGLHFFAKAGLAVLVGAGSIARDYVHTNYALISQSATAVLMVSVGLTLLSVLVLEIMADERSASEMDALSGIANRRGFERGVKAAIAAASSYPHAVVLCDLDHFKRINDTFGHHGGDAVIESFGALLRSSAPSGAILGRIGGEEFAVFLPKTTVEVAALFAQALRAGTMTMSVAGIPSLNVTGSFGVAHLTAPDQSEQMFRQADMALYEAKRSGRNCVRQANQDPHVRHVHLRPIK